MSFYKNKNLFYRGKTRMHVSDLWCQWQWLSFRMTRIFHPFANLLLTVLPLLAKQTTIFSNFYGLKALVACRTNDLQNNYAKFDLKLAFIIASGMLMVSPFRKEICCKKEKWPEWQRMDLLCEIYQSHGI